MDNFTFVAQDLIPQNACEFYYGYYSMSTDMGSLLLKLALIFAVLELLHKFFQFSFSYLSKRFFSK